MNRVCCGSDAVTERPEVTARGYRRIRCRTCGQQFNERSSGVLNRSCLPNGVIAFVLFCRLRYRLTLRDLSEIMALLGIKSVTRRSGTERRSCSRSWATSGASIRTIRRTDLRRVGMWMRPI